MTTFVLVHGGWHGGWGWRRVARLLRSDGHEVHTPTLTGVGDRAHLGEPGTGLAAHVADVVAVLELDDLRDVVLVGHSSAGAVVAGVARECADRLREVVAFDAFVLQPGQSVFSAVPAGNPVQFVLGPDEAGRLPLDRDVALEHWGVEDPADRAWIRARLRPHPARALTDPLPPGSEPDLPRRFVHCTVKPTGDSFAGFAAVARDTRGWRVDTIDAGHDAMITAPREVAALLVG